MEFKELKKQHICFVFNYAFDSAAIPLMSLAEKFLSVFFKIQTH